MGFSSSTLKLVPQEIDYGTVPITSVQGIRGAHSLHRLAFYPHSAHVEVVRELLLRFSNPGDRVLDPFCGFGSVIRESILNRRVALGSDIDPLCSKISNASLLPADIVEVTLALQTAVSKIPVDMVLFEQYFSPFFHQATFSELMSFRRSLKGGRTPALAYVEAIAMSLLHGKGAGYFSYSPSSATSMTPAARKQKNQREDSMPDYRALVPRILRRTAQIMQEGIPSHFDSSARRSRVYTADARRLSFLESDGADFILSNPPLPFDRELSEGFWIKRWFLGVQDPFEQGVSLPATKSAWLDFMNESLFELARITKPGRYCAFMLRHWKSEENIAEELIEMASDNLGKYWQTHAFLHASSDQQSDVQSEELWRAMKHKRNSSLPSVVVFRRR